MASNVLPIEPRLQAGRARPPADVRDLPIAPVVDLAAVRAARRGPARASLSPLAWQVNASNEVGWEDGQVHLRVHRDGAVLCVDALSPDEAFQLGQCVLATAAVAARRRRGTVELRLRRADGAPVEPPRTVEGVPLARNADAVLLRVGEDEGWFVLSTGLPLHRGPRASYWHLCPHDARYLQRALSTEP